jgi:hypothetical protein
MLCDSSDSSKYCKQSEAGWKQKAKGASGLGCPTYGPPYKRIFFGFVSCLIRKDLEQWVEMVLYVICVTRQISTTR